MVNLYGAPREFDETNDYEHLTKGKVCSCSCTTSRIHLSSYTLYCAFFAFTLVQDEGVAYRGAALVEIRAELTEGTPSVPVAEIDREDIIRVQVRRCTQLCSLYTLVNELSEFLVRNLLTSESNRESTSPELSPEPVEVPAHAQVPCVPRAAERVVHAAKRGRADRDQRVDGPVRRLNGELVAAGDEHDGALVAAAVLRDERRRELRVRRGGHQVPLPAVEREPPVQPARGAVRAHHLPPRGAQPVARPQEQTRELTNAHTTTCFPAY